jgi:CRP-like cAMP-binding protein
VTEHLIERFARDYASGCVLFREGDVGDFMYVIQAGTVEIGSATASGCWRCCRRASSSARWR